MRVSNTVLQCIASLGQAGKAALDAVSIKLGVTETAPTLCLYSRASCLQSGGQLETKIKALHSR